MVHPVTIPHQEAQIEIFFLQSRVLLKNGHVYTWAVLLS